MLHHEGNPLFLSLLCLHLPFFNLPLKLQFFLLPGIPFILFVIDKKLDILQLRLFLSQILLSTIKFIFNLSILFQDELIFQLKVLSSSQPNPRPIKILLNSITVILKPTDFSLIEIHIIFRRRFAVHPLSNLLF